MKGAINYADKIVVVSPKYAGEILGSEFGEGMDYTLRGKTDKLVGILNGIDYDAFNPKKDKSLVKNFDIKSLKNKEENKKAILKEFGLNYNPDRPLIALISRLVGQKGIDLIRDMENELRNMSADFIFLGSGDKEYENLFIWLSNNTPNIRTYVGYRGDLANLIYAGSDFFLMPSKFEPCGLSQLIAMRYGSLPIVRATGGLDNTVVGYPLDNSTGFKFWEYDGRAMRAAIDCALNVYKDKYTLNAMRESAMKADFSWKESAKQYLEMYKSLL
jgi:starch synthase